jgi:hypothetical protein
MPGRRFCPCRPCKAVGAKQILKTIRDHLKKDGLPAFERSRSRLLRSEQSEPIAEASNNFPSSPEPIGDNSNAETEDQPDYDLPDMDFHTDRSTSTSPLSLDEELAPMDFRNRALDREVQLGYASSSDSDNEASDNEEELVIIEEDPDFVPRERLFAGLGDLEHQPEPPEDVPLAFFEHPAIRNAYIHVFANAAFGSATNVQSQNSLIALQSAMTTVQDPLNPIEGLENMALTLPTLERRLGVNPDAHITYFFLCPDCWKRHDPAELNQLKSPQCGQEACSGVLYTVKRTARRAEKRTPTKIMPYCSIKKSIPRLLQRPGIWEQCQKWRKDGDHGPSDQMTSKEYITLMTADTVINDIHDGFAWRDVPAFMERKWDARTRKVEDHNTLPGRPRRFVSLPCGLLIALNIDWYNSELFAPT